MELRANFHFAACAPFWFWLVSGLAALLAAPPAMAMTASCRADPEPLPVNVTTEDGLTLVATYYAPRETKQKSPGVLLLHGAGGSRADLDALALRLQKSGFAALTVDLRGHGESATDELTWKKLDSNRQASTWAFMARDVKASVEFLLGQANVNPKALSLLGHGAGCALVARHAMRDEKVHELVLLSPQTEQQGSTLTKDLVQLVGLPIFIGVSQAEAAQAKRMAETANREAGGQTAVEAHVAKVDEAGLLGDTKISAEIARWLKSKAAPCATKAPEAQPIH